MRQFKFRAWDGEEMFDIDDIWGDEKKSETAKYAEQRMLKYLQVAFMSFSFVRNVWFKRGNSGK